MSLAKFHTQNRELKLLQDSWATTLDPMLTNPSLKSIILKGIPLITGANVVNTTLGRNLQGWRIVRLRASATIYDTQDSNPTPHLTLTLVSSAPAVVDLEIF